MRKYLALFLASLLTWASPAHASFDPLLETTKIPGIRTAISRTVFLNSGRLLAILQTAFQNHVKVGPKNPLVRNEIECAIAKLAQGFIQDMMLNPGAYPDLTPDDFKGMPDALANYKARENQWCGPPPNGGVNRGVALVQLFTKRNTEGIPQAREKTEEYASRAKQIKEPKITAGDVALAVAIGLAIAAREAVPVPFP